MKVKSLSRVRLLATHGLQPTRLLRPWDLPDKSTGVGCHCLLQSISSLPRDWQILNQVEKKAEFTFQYGVILRQNIWKELMTSRRRQWHPTPVLLPRKSHGQRNLVGCSPWGRYSRTRLSDFTFTFHFHALEKEMATHSSVLAWRIPGTGSLVGCRLRGCTESDTTEATQQQQQHDI